MGARDEKLDRKIFAGLRALVESAFPKECKTCGRLYASADDFFRETDSVNGRSGLKASENEDGSPLVELFRNCVCGSTLMDAFHDRRDRGERGLARREKFGAVLDQLVETGMVRERARLELLRVLRGESSEILSELLGRKV